MWRARHLPCARVNCMTRGSALGGVLGHGLLDLLGGGAFVADGLLGADRGAGIAGAVLVNRADHELKVLALFQALHAHGFSDEDIWDIGAVTALFALSNRMASLTSMRPNDEFYAMGRSFADKS